ncbi:helix-turn-helix domain-containing protein [Streptomyces acidicola]|uniref:helix-turn-helix domain-containing protein n=1 Tax=Streptomyces acidicola TaxID=2596892 RepID=UPI00381D0D4E
MAPAEDPSTRQLESVEAVAAKFRVSVPTERSWRRRWREGGVEALRSRGPASVERLSTVHGPV